LNGLLREKKKSPSTREEKQVQKGVIPPESLGVVDPSPPLYSHAEAKIALLVCVCACVVFFQPSV